MIDDATMQTYDLIAVDPIGGDEAIIERGIDYERIADAVLAGQMRAVSGEYGARAVVIARASDRSPSAMLERFTNYVWDHHRCLIVKYDEDSDQLFDLDDLTGSELTEQTLIESFVDATGAERNVQS